MPAGQYKDHRNLHMRLKPHIGRLLREISLRQGLTETSVVTTALLEYAQNRNIPVPEPEPEEEKETAAA